MNCLRRFISAVLCVSLTLSFFMFSSAAEAAEPGTVRVLLGLSGKSNRMDIGIYGSYLVNESFSFQRGSTLKIEAKDSIWLYYEGAAVNAGNRLRLVHQSAKADEENGLRLNDSLNLLEGDLMITLSGTTLRVVLHIGIEDYLKGLVPYEMSDSFPLEALKAQAIAARSYAMRGLRQDRDYDLSDDTNDQVYRGFNKEHTQAHRAVKETEGIVLTYNEQIIQAFYTASNGGQTESSAHAWGREDFAYLPIRDDIYDLENPQSAVKSFYLAKTWKADSSVLKELDNILIQKLAPRLESMGYEGSAENIRIDRLSILSAHTPKYGGGSRLMTQLRFIVQVSAKRFQILKDEEEILLFKVENSPQSADSALDLPEEKKL